MRYALHSPGSTGGDVTQVGWNRGRKRKIYVQVPAGGVLGQPATPVVYIGHSRGELVEGGIQQGMQVTPATSPFVFHDWTGDCYAVSSPDGVVALITSEEEQAPDWNRQRDGQNS